MFNDCKVLTRWVVVSSRLVEAAEAMGKKTARAKKAVFIENCMVDDVRRLWMSELLEVGAADEETKMARLERLLYLADQDPRVGLNWKAWMTDHLDSVHAPKMQYRPGPGWS